MPGSLRERTRTAIDSECRILCAKRVELDEAGVMVSGVSSDMVGVVPPGRKRRLMFDVRAITAWTPSCWIADAAKPRPGEMVQGPPDEADRRISGCAM
jgi:hypothetical protein